MTTTILQGDCRETLKTVEAGSVQTIVTSPPYYGLRDYGVDNQIGLEDSPEKYISELVAVFRECWRALADDGTLWVNIGDSYSGSGKGGQSEEKRSENWQPVYANKGKTYGLKPKDLIGIPWMLAFALRADGWYLRSEIIWHKPNPMPESVTDRPTKSHEQIFLLSKSAQYFYDADAIAEPTNEPWAYGQEKRIQRVAASGGALTGGTGDITSEGTTRNKRTVWTVTTKPYSGAHFATFPPDLIEPCILAGSRPGDTVMDPFNGSGTTGAVAIKHHRNYIGCELNSAYIELTNDRFSQVQPVLIGL